jgi:formate dehydrogenase major subunit
MKLSRRNFLKLTGTAAAASVLVGTGLKGVAEAAGPVRVHYGREVPTVCTFCGVGCGIICSVQDGVIINAEGDPDHPINEGSLCSKGSSSYNISYIYDSKGRPKPNPSRVTEVLYRAPKSDKWEVKSWEWALPEIAKRIKEQRDGDNAELNKPNFDTVDANGVTVNRNNALAWIGSAFCTNEENYLFHKMCRAMGVVNLDHCARL